MVPVKVKKLHLHPEAVIPSVAIAQFEEVDELGGTDRGVGGFGSSEVSVF